MINVTRLNDREVVVNCELIELVEAMPDTTITLNTGRKIIVLETVEEVVSKVVDFKKRIKTE